MNNTTWPIPTNISIFSTLSTGASTKESNSIFVASHVIIVVLAPVAVLGNALVLTAIWRRSFQRTTFHILLSVLAFTDLLTGFASPNMSIPYLLNHEFGVVSRSGILISTYLLCLTILVITLMSVERWLHMTHRSLLTSHRGRYRFVVLSLLAPVPLVTLQALNLNTNKMKLETNAVMGAYGLSCYLATSVAYFKVFRIIRQHQQQIHTTQSRQNCGQPAIDLAKYKKSIFSILYILALFSLCILPFIVSLFLLVLLGEDEESWGPYHVSLVLLFLTSCLNPGLYIWRMKDVRVGVKKLCCCTNGSH